jgi:hypothetical protein
MSSIIRLHYPFFGVLGKDTIILSLSQFALNPEFPPFFLIIDLQLIPIPISFLLRKQLSEVLDVWIHPFPIRYLQQDHKVRIHILEYNFMAPS